MDSDGVMKTLRVQNAAKGHGANVSIRVDHSHWIHACPMSGRNENTSVEQPLQLPGTDVIWSQPRGDWKTVMFFSWSYVCFSTGAKIPTLF